jgi:hypothetical protein
MFNNKRYKFSQTEEESTEENSNISFVDFLSKLQYYRFGPFRDDNSNVESARTLFPFYLSNNSHENLINIGFAITYVPGGEVSSVVEFYNYLRNFDPSLFKDPQYIQNVTYSFSWKERGLNIQNLDASLRTKFIDWLSHQKSSDVTVEQVNKLLTFDNRTVYIFIHSAPMLFSDLLRFYETYPDYFPELAQNPHLNRPMITNFIENPNLMNNFDTINRIYYISENSIIINRYLAQWGENLDLSDLSEEEFRTFSNSISFYDANSVTVSPDIVKTVIKNHKAYDYISKISTSEYPFLNQVYNLTKLTGNNFDAFIDSLETNYDEELQSKKGVLTAGFLTENLKQFNPILENVSFVGIKGFFAPNTILGFLAAVPEENLKIIVDNNSLRGMFKYIDNLPGINKPLSEFEKYFIGKVPYDVLKLFKTHVKTTDQEEIKKASSFVISATANNLLNQHIQESGLSWTDPQTIYYSYLNSKKFANIPVSEYFEAHNKLKQLFSGAINNKNETGDSVFDLSIAPYFIPLFGKNIPQKISEAFDRDSINFEFYDFRQTLNNLSYDNTKLLGNYIITNQEILTPWQLKLLIRNAEYFKNITDKFDTTNPETIYRLSPAKLLNYLHRNIDEPDIESKIDLAFQNIYRTIDPNSELYNIMQIIMNSNVATIGSSPKAFSYVFDKISELKNENIDNAAKIVAMFNKRSELYLKKYDNNVHDAAQIIPNIISDKLKTKGAEFALRSNLTRDKLSTILESFDLVSDEDLLMPEKDLYNKIFLENVKRNATEETQSDDFLLEFSSHGFKIETFKTANFSDDDWFSELDEDGEEYLAEPEENYLTYKEIENLYLRSLSIPLPDWAQDFKTTATYSKKQLVGYFLPREDTRGMFLGKYTGCCQHPDGEGWTCSILGQISQNSCFFVIENAATKEIVCQSWVYKLYGSDGQRSWGEDLVVFDNVEAIGIGNRMNTVVEMYKTTAKHIAQFGYTVILGDTGDIDIDNFPDQYNGNFDLSQLREDTEDIYTINVDVYTDASSARVLAEYSYDDEEEMQA